MKTIKYFSTRQGFTLTELMIVVGIIGILAAIGVPSYLTYLQKGRLQTVKAVMMEGAQLLERAYSLNNSYPDASNYPSVLKTSPKTGEGSTTYFDITYTPANNNTTYSLVAVVKSPYTASTCQSLQYNSTGEKLASDTNVIGGATTASSARCWGS